MSRRNRDATPVRDADGQTGWLDGPFSDDVPVDIRLDSGERLRLAAGLVEQSSSGALRTRVSFADLVDEVGEDLGDDPELVRRASTETFQEIREDLKVSKILRETGRVRVTVKTSATNETVTQPVWRDAVNVRRVDVGEVVTEVEDVRTEDDVTVIPVYEEVLVVERRLMLRERLYVTVRREVTEASETVALRKQTVEVERLPAADSLPGAERPSTL